MNSETLRTFVTLAQLGSYTKTAQKMIVVPSTISKQIKQLEAEVGRPLVIRDKKTVKLTQAGEVLLKHARRALEAEADCIGELNALDESGGSIRIGAVNSLFQSHVTKWLNRWLLENPRSRVSVVTDHSQILLNKLYDGEIDLCFAYRAFRENNCICMPFVEDEMILVTGRGNAVPEGGVTVSELKRLPLVKETQLSVADPKLYAEVFDRNDNVLLSVSMGNLIVPFLLAGNGYGFVVARYVRDALASGALVRVPVVDHPAIQLKSYLVFKKANPLATDALIDDIRGYADRQK
ncbi:MAG: LysR family transcriptional regulator [Clostridia bacterium]|nr:LysR family transcriptional regulator [Clostridia bacterium]